MSPVLAALILCAAQPAPPAGPPVVPGRDTTFVTGPLRPDGGIDYQAVINDRLSKGVTPETNAVVLLWAAMGPKPEGGEMPPEFFARLGVPRPPDAGDYLLSFGRFLKDVKKLAPEENQKAIEEQGRSYVAPWSREELPLVAEWLTLNEKPLAVAIEATRRPHYFLPLVARGDENGPGPLIGALLPSVQRCREVATLLTARAMLRTSEGKHDEAWGDIVATFRLGRLCVCGGTLIERLVGIALEAIADRAMQQHLAAAKPDAATLRKRLADVRALPAMPTLADGLDFGERMFFLDSYQLVRRGGAKALAGLGGPGVEIPPVGAEALQQFDWNPMLRDGNRYYDRMAAALRLPTRAERQRELGKIDADARDLSAKGRGLGGLYTEILKAKAAGKSSEEAARDATARTIGNTLIALLLPAVQKVSDADDRLTQQGRNREVFFALALHCAEAGRYPATLAELSPKYLSEVPDDVFAGKPLAYKPAGDGYLLYSVGPNGKDDAGRWFDDEPRGDDPGVRVPPAGPKKAG